MQIFAKSLSLTINPENLVTLANGVNNKDTIPELKGYDVKNIGNDALRDAMVRRQQKAQEELIESAAEQLVGVLAATDIAIQNQLAELRRGTLVATVNFRYQRAINAHLFETADDVVRNMTLMLKILATSRNFAQQRL